MMQQLGLCCPHPIISTITRRYFDDAVTNTCRSTISKLRYSTFPTSLRISSDLDGKYLVRHAAALRIMDHTLHISGIIGKAPNYTHNWLCITNAVTVFPREHFLQESFLYCDDIRSLIWVASVGTGSSVTFGHAITMKDSICLATASRVFVRYDPKTNKAAPFTEEERGIFVQNHSRLGRTPDKCLSIDFEKYILPEAKRLEAAPLQNQFREQSILTVRIGPQHVNFANHVDHAFLLETASHALFLRDTMIHAKNEGLAPTTLVVNYKSSAELNQYLHCFTYDNKAIIYSSVDERNCSKKDPVLVAEISSDNAF